MTARRAPKVSPMGAVVMMIASIGSLAAFRSIPALAMYAGLATIALIIQLQNARVAVVMIKWCLPFVVPLLFVHGVMNASYPTAYWLMDVIPWRPTGFRYGVIVSLHFIVIATIAAYWLHTERDDLVDALIRMKFPIWSILFVTQGVAVGAMVERRVSNVYLAQRARGICVGPGILARLRAFPSVLIPAVIGTLLEAESRIPALVSRGFGSSKLAVPPKPFVRIANQLWSGIPILIFALVGLFEFLS